MKVNKYVGIYTFWCIVYVYINKSVFKSTLFHFENIGFLFVSINIFAFFFKYNPKWFNQLNLIVIFVLFASFLMLPQYTYKEAVTIISNINPNNTEIIDNANNNYNFKIGTPQIYKRGKGSFFMKGEYLIYLLDKNNNTIIWYKFNPIDGKYIILTEYPN